MIFLIALGVIILAVGSSGNVAEEVARATKRNRKNFPGLDKEVT